MDDVKDLAYQDYISGMKYKDIAAKYGIKESTVKSWASRYWKSGKKLQAKKKKVATEHKKVATGKADKRLAAAVAGAAEQDEELTDKQKLFCIYWIRNKNATIAAKAAGYATDSAHVEGCRLLKNAKVRAYIELFISEIRNSVMIDAMEIVERHMKIAFADMTDYVEWGQEFEPVMGPAGPLMTKDAVTGEPIPVMRGVNTVRFKESTMVDGGLVSEVTQGKNGTKIKIENRQHSLDWLSKYFLMNPMDKHKVAYDNALLKLKQDEISFKNF